MGKTTELSSNYEREVEASKVEAICYTCYDRGYYMVFNAYELGEGRTCHCECPAGKMFLDNKLKALNSEFRRGFWSWRTIRTTVWRPSLKHKQSLTGVTDP